MKKYKQQAALNRVVSIIPAIDNERYHWMLSDCHYKYKYKGKYELTIWLDSLERAKALETDIRTQILQEGDSIETKEFDSEETPYIITIQIRY